MSQSQLRFSERESAILCVISEYARSLTPEQRVKLVELPDVGKDRPDDHYSMIFTRLLYKMGAIDHKGTITIAHDAQERADHTRQLNSGLGVANLPVATGTDERELYDGKYHSERPTQRQSQWMRDYRSGYYGGPVPSQEMTASKLWETATTIDPRDLNSTRALTVLATGGLKTLWLLLDKHPKLSDRDHIEKIVTQGGSEWVDGVLVPNFGGSNNKYARSASTAMFKHAQDRGISTATSWKETAYQTRITAKVMNFFQKTGHSLTTLLSTYATELPKVDWEDARYTRGNGVDIPYTVKTRLDYTQEVRTAQEDAYFAAGCPAGHTAEAFESQRAAYAEKQTDHDKECKHAILSQDPYPDWDDPRFRVGDNYVLPMYDFWSVPQAVPDLASRLDLFDDSALQTWDSEGRHTCLGIEQIKENGRVVVPGKGGLKDPAQAAFFFQTVIKAELLSAVMTSQANRDGLVTVTMMSEGERYRHVYIRGGDDVWRYNVYDTQAETSGAELSV